jgi:uncharacterized protein
MTQDLYRKKSFQLALLFVGLLVFGNLDMVFGQDARISSVTHNRHIIKSKILNEDRSILVRLPESYARSSQKFPVVYMLDGHGSYLSLMPGTLDHLFWSGHIPEMILVSIQNTDRTRDLTPTKTAQRPTSGGGDNFLQFIETEVMPLVENNYHTQPFRIFAGHSLGGLQVVYAFVSRPELFQAYIAASPVLHWDNNFVIKRAEEIFKQKRAWKKTMFLALGSEPDYQDGFNAFKDLLGRVKPDRFDYEFRQMPEENHQSAALQAYYWGLRKIYAGWPPPASGTMVDVESHYKKLSAKYGYTISIPENLLNSIGYQLLGANKTSEAIEIFKRNVELYPDSVNVYDSLAEAYERDKQFESAKKSYEKALTLAERNGNTGLAQTIKRNLERVNGKAKAN